MASPLPCCISQESTGKQDQHSILLGDLSKLPGDVCPGLSVHPWEPRRLAGSYCSQSVVGCTTLASSWGAVCGWELGGLHLFLSSQDSPEPGRDPASSLPSFTFCFTHIGLYFIPSLTYFMSLPSLGLCTYYSCCIEYHFFSFVHLTPLSSFRHQFNPQVFRKACSDWFLSNTLIMLFLS